MRALLGQIHLPGLDREGPQDLAQLLRIFYALFGAGFLVGVLGHLFGSRALRAIGIAMIMIGTLVFMVAVGTYD